MVGDAQSKSDRPRGKPVGTQPGEETMNGIGLAVLVSLLLWAIVGYVVWASGWFLAVW